MNRVLQGQGHTFAYSIDTEKCQKSAKKLKEMMDSYKGKKYKKTVFIDKLEQTAKLLAKLTLDSDV